MTVTILPKFHNHGLMLPLTDRYPDCAQPENDPAWWDTDTHDHTSTREPCIACTAAAGICGMCPLKSKCQQIGAMVRQPSLIYGGVIFHPAGRVPNCDICGNPLPVKSGRVPEALVCSNQCGRRLRRRREAGRPFRRASSELQPQAPNPEA